MSDPNQTTKPTDDQRTYATALVHSADEEGVANLLVEIGRYRRLLVRWLELDGDSDDVAALIAETRSAVND